MHRQHSPVRWGGRVLHEARSRSDHPPRSRDEAPLKAAMTRLAEAWPPDGSRRITALLPREQGQGNRTHGARRMRALGRPRQRPACRPRTTDRAHPYPRSPNRVQDREITPPDHGGVGDMPDVRRQQVCVYRAVMMEVSTRAMRGWHLSRHLDQSLTVTAWRRALGQHRPELHHADQGVQ